MICLLLSSHLQKTGPSGQSCEPWPRPSSHQASRPAPSPWPLLKNRWRRNPHETPVSQKKKTKKTLESMKVSQIFKNCPTPQKKMCETQHVQYLLTPETRLSVLRIFSCLLMSFSSQSSWPGVVEWQVATTPPQPSSDPHGWSHHQASVQVMFQVPNIVGPLMSRWHGGSRRTFYWPTSGWWIWVRDGNISWSTGFRSTHHHPSG